MKKWLKNIEPETVSTYVNKTFVTVDVDWAPDNVLNDTIDLFEENEVESTWFVTHETAVNERLVKSELFEVAIHPNFNKVLSGDLLMSSKDVISNMLDLLPHATTVRSHSMTQNSVLLDEFVKNGLKADSNTFIPFNSGMEIKPYRHWNGLIKIPYNWEDDVHIEYGWNYDKVFDSIQSSDFNVLDFHPIHLFLNSCDLELYSSIKHKFKNGLITEAYRNKEHFGTRDFFVKLIEQRVIC